jgi:hypothetical protein
MEKVQKCEVQEQSYVPSSESFKTTTCIDSIQLSAFDLNTLYLACLIFNTASDVGWKVIILKYKHERGAPPECNGNLHKLSYLHLSKRYRMILRGRLSPPSPTNDRPSITNLTKN